MNKWLEYDLEEHFFPSLIKLLGAERLELEAEFSLEEERIGAHNAIGDLVDQVYLIPKVDKVTVYAGSRIITDELEEYLPMLWKALKEELDQYASDLTEEDFSE